MIAGMISHQGSRFATAGAAFLIITVMVGWSSCARSAEPTAPPRPAAESSPPVDGAPSASTAWATPEQIARWDAEFASLAVMRTPNVFRVRLVDQFGRPVPNFPVWINDVTYKTNSASEHFAGHSPYSVVDKTIPTDANGIATYTGGGSYSFTFGVNGRFVKLPWIIPEEGNDQSADCLQGLRSSADSERDIREGRQAPRPHHMTAVVYKVEGRSPMLWTQSRVVAELQDPDPRGFASVPMVFFECSKAFPRRHPGNPQTSSAWIESRRIQREDAMPWAHLVVHGGVLPSATTGAQPVLSSEGQEQTPWWVEVQAQGADVQLVPTDQRFPLVAPEGGYHTGLRWQVPLQQSTFRQWLWFRIQGTPVRYGCWEMRAERSDSYSWDNTAARKKYEMSSGKVADRKDWPDVVTRPARITLSGPLFLNPTGSRHLERWLNSSQSDEWRDLMVDPTSPLPDTTIPARALFSTTPADVSGVQRLPPQTIVIPVPPAPAPAAAALTEAEIDELRAIPDNAVMERRMTEMMAQKAAAAASAARP